MRVLLFTGHRIDAPGREQRRFPPDKEGSARRKIKEAVEAESASGEGVAFGIAGGASGGDILFHEVCEELGVPTRLYLALGAGPYVEASVADAGPAWVERFRRLHSRLSERGAVRLMSDAADEPDSDIWQRCNLWMLRDALAAGGDKGVTLVALWDGEGGDGPGGTRDLVDKVQNLGAPCEIIKTQEL